MITDASKPIPKAITDAVEALKVAVMEYAKTGYEERLRAIGLAAYMENWLRDCQVLLRGGRFPDPPLAIVEIPSEPDTVGAYLHRLHEEALAAPDPFAIVGQPAFVCDTPEQQRARRLTVENPTAFISVGTAPSSGLSIKTCDCDSRLVIADNARYYCTKSSGGPFCTCRCHPENR